MTNTQTTNPTRTEAKDGRWLALIVLCAGFMMIILDSTIVNVALPSIQEDLGFSQSTLAWVVNGYLIAFGGLLLLSGRLGDLIGRRRVFLFGLALFTAASLACGFASSQELLVGARFIQGIGGALTSAVILGMIVTMFPDPKEQGKAIGIYSFVASAGASIGLLAGGALTQAISWHWIFFVNVPIGVATALLALRYVEDDEGLGLDRGADVLGALLVTGAVMLGVYTVLERQRPRVDVGPHARVRRRVARAARRLPDARGARGDADDPAARVPLAQPLGREPHDRADGGRAVRHVLPRRPVPAADPRLTTRSRPASRSCPSRR